MTRDVTSDAPDPNEPTREKSCDTLTCPAFGQAHWPSPGGLPPLKPPALFWGAPAPQTPHWGCRPTGLPWSVFGCLKPGNKAYNLGLEVADETRNQESARSVDLPQTTMPAHHTSNYTRANWIRQLESSTRFAAAARPSRTAPDNMSLPCCDDNPFGEGRVDRPNPGKLTI